MQVGDHLLLLIPRIELNDCGAVTVTATVSPRDVVEEPTGRIRIESGNVGLGSNGQRAKIPDRPGPDIKTPEVVISLSCRVNESFRSFPGGRPQPKRTWPVTWGLTGQGVVPHQLPIDFVHVMNRSR